MGLGPNRILAEIAYRSLRLQRQLDRFAASGYLVARVFSRALRHLISDRIAPEGAYPARVDGMLMYAYAGTRDFRRLALRPYEPYTIKLFKQALRQGVTVLDIGAQYGYFSLVAAKTVSPTGRVHAFEPAPSNYRLLKRSIRSNGLEAIINAVPKAVGDEQRSVSMHLYDETQSHSMHPHACHGPSHEIEVECITIDEYLKGQTVDVIKMDIEGHEPFALMGMQETILRSQSLVMIAELNPPLLKISDTEPEHFLKQLDSLGFDVKLIEEGTESLRKVTSDDLVKALEILWAPNLYCTKRSP